MDKTLTQDDIKRWLKEQGHIKFLLEKGALDEDNLDHIAMCMHHIYRWYWEDYPIGHFLGAVVENDFMEACGRADSTNKLVLPIYATFLYNCAPMDYRKKAKEQ